MTYYSRYFFGSYYDDVIEANDRSNVIFGFSGSDTIYARGGNDVVFAGSGNDTVFGGTGHDRLYGGRGDDALFGEAGNDLLVGGRGNDQLDGGAGYDVLYAGRGHDMLIYVAAENTSNYDYYDGGRGVDTLVIRVNATLANDEVFLSEIEALRDHITEYTTFRGQFWGPSFYINSLNLRVDDVEIIQIVVDDTEGVQSEANEDDAAFSVNLLDFIEDRDPNEVFTISNVEGLTSAVTLNGTILNVDPAGDEFQALAEGEIQTISISYTVTDSSGASTQQTAVITITGTNDVPVLAAALSADVTEDGAAITVDLLEGASDVDASDVLSIANLEALSDGVSLNGNLLTIDPSNAAFQALGAGETQTIVIGYDIVDGNGGSVSQSVTLTVTGSNDAPIVAAALTADAAEDDNSITINLLEGASDVDTGDILSIANLEVLPDGVSLDGTVLTVDPSDAAFQGLGAGETQTLTVAYDIIDGNGGSVSQTGTITVTGTNDVPVVAAVLSASATENGAAVSLDLLAGASDLDQGDVLSVVLTDELPAGVTLEGTILTLNPDSEIFNSLIDGDSIDVIVNYSIVDSAGASVPQTATFNVAGANDAPLVTGSLEVQTVIIEEIFSFNPTELFSEVDEGDSLTFAVTGTDGAALPAWLSFDPMTGEIAGMPGPDDTGLQAIEVTATDTFGASTTQTLFVVVAGANAGTGRSIIGRFDNFTETIFETGEGVDAHIGTFASDTFIVNPDGGTDVLNFSFGNELDTVIIRGATLDELEFSIPDAQGFASDVIMTFPDGSSVLLATFLQSNISFVFEEDGLVLTPEETRLAVFEDFFTDGDDEIGGISSADVLEGGLGDDVISGGRASDTYIFNVGDGDDTYEENGDRLDEDGHQDIVEIRGYNLADATFSRATPGSSDLLISFGNGDSIRLVGTLDDSSTDYFEIIRFDDVEITPETIQMTLLDDSFPDFDQIIIGDDTDNTLEGGAGDDYLSGGFGGDTYIYTGGNDIVEDVSFTSGDRLEIQGFSSTDAEVTILEEDRDSGQIQLRLDFGAGDSLIIFGSRFPGQANYIEEIFYAGDNVTQSFLQILPPIPDAALGTDGDDIIRGNDNDETLEGGLGNDFLAGGDGNDTYIFNRGDGRDIIFDSSSASDADALNLTGYNLSDALFTDVGENADLLLTFVGTTDSIYIEGGLSTGSSSGVESFVFDDVTLDLDGIRDVVLEQQQTDGDDVIRDFSRDDIINAGAGNDLIFLTGGNNTIDGGLGNDRVIDGAGNDIFNGGDGNDSFQGNSFLSGSDDTLNGEAGGDFLSGGTGNDTLIGGTGNDTLLGGADDDTYIFNAGDGEDFIFDSGDNDVLDFNGYDFADAIFSRRDGSDDLLIEFAGSTDSVVIGLALGSSNSRWIETFMFDDMTVDFETEILPLIDILIG